MIFLVWKLKKTLESFLKVLEAVTKKMKENELDSKTLIKLLLSNQDLYSGIELTVQSIVTAAVKISVESVEESLVSRYESHFDSMRQLKEINALEELVHADKIITFGMNKY